MKSAACKHCGAAGALRRPYARDHVCATCEASREALAHKQLLALARRVARLNTASPTIGAGMLATLVGEARSALQLAGEVVS